MRLLCNYESALGPRSIEPKPDDRLAPLATLGLPRRLVTRWPQWRATTREGRGEKTLTVSERPLSVADRCSEIAPTLAGGSQSGVGPAFLAWFDFRAITNPPFLIAAVSQNPIADRPPFPREGAPVSWFLPGRNGGPQAGKAGAGPQDECGQREPSKLLRIASRNKPRRPPADFRKERVR